MSNSMDKRYVDFCKTERQREVLQAYLKYGTLAVTAKMLDVGQRTIERILFRIRAQASNSGYDPEAGLEIALPTGQRIKSVSTLLDAENNKVLQWVKASEESLDTYQQIVESVENAFAAYEGKAKKIKKPKKVLNKDILTVYPIGDPHLGLFAWGEETLGEDWDLDLGEAYLRAGIDRIMDLAPSSKECLIINLGDLVHIDNHIGITPTSKAFMDFESKLGRIYEVGISLILYAIDKALEKHSIVHVQSLVGNHDQTTGVMLAASLALFFRGNDRVKFSESKQTFRFHEFGKCLIGMTHGDRPRKVEKLKDIMTTDQPEAWGRTKHRYWYIGHVHHSRKIELPGVLIESFRTLIPKDKWHYDSGYRAGRDISCIVLHKEWGEIERSTVPVAMIRGDIQKKE